MELVFSDVGRTKNSYNIPLDKKRLYLSDEVWHIVGDAGEKLISGSKSILS